MRKLLMLTGGVLVLFLLVVLASALLLDPDDYREEIAARAGSLLGRELELKGPLRLKLWPWLAVRTEEVWLDNPPDFGEAPALARIGRVEAGLRLWPLLRGELEFTRLSLSDAHLTLVTHRDGRSNLEGLLAADQPGREAGPAVDLSRLSLGPVQFERVVLERLDLGDGQRTLVQIDRLDLASFRPDQPVPLRFRGSLTDGETALLEVIDFVGDVRVTGDLSRLQLDNWRVSLMRSTARVRAEGALQVQLDQPVPVLLLERLSAQVDLLGQAMGLELQQPLRLMLGEVPAGQLAAARFTLNGQVLNLAGAFELDTPLTAELAFSGARLDLRPLMIAVAADSAGSAGGAGGVSALNDLRLTLGLELDELVLDDRLRLSALSTQARLQHGVLRIEPIRAEWFGGRLDGLASLDFTAAPPRIRIQPGFSGIRAEQVAELLGQAPPLRGLGEMRLDLAFSGLSLPEILASLDGEGSFRLDDGALLGVDLRRLIADKLTVSTLGNVSQAFAGETPFRSLSASLRAESGVVLLPDLAFNAADFGAAGQGRLDFAAGTVDYRLDLRLGDALIERLPRQLARATGGVIPLAIGGPLSRPRVEVDLVSLAEGALQRELQDRLLERLRPPPDQQDQRASEGDEQAMPERRERTRDLLLRSLRDRQDREPPNAAP